MANKHMKRRSTSHVTGELQTKTKNITAHLLEWLKSRTLATPNAGEEPGTTGNLLQYSWECKNGRATSKDRLIISYKIKHTYSI